MLQGLLFKKLFVIADVFLACLVALVAVLMVLEAFGGESHSEAAQTLPRDVEALDHMFASVGHRSQYNGIAQSGIFGPAASKNRNSKEPKKAPPAPLPIEEAITELPLRLWGTVVSGDNVSLATAVIEVREGAPKLGTYFVGQEVIPQVFLQEVRRKEVVLDNKRLNRLEHLTMADRKDRSSSRRASKTRSPTRPSASQVVTISRSEFSRDLIDNYAEIASKVDVQLYTDETGKVLGLTSSNISGLSLAQKLGLQDNDILTSVNNEPIDSVDKVYSIVNKYRNASTFRIGIIRNGQPKYITYRLR